MDDMVTESVPTSRWHVNRQLLPVKAIYFTFLAAIGDLLPFITVYMKQLGLTSTEAGIIYGVMPFIAFFVRPMFGAVADKFHCHRLVLSICVLFTGLCYTLLLLVPAKTTAGPRLTSVRTHVQCDRFDSFVHDCEPSQGFIAGTCENRNLKWISNRMESNLSSISCEMECIMSISLGIDDTKVCFTDDVGPVTEAYCGTNNSVVGKTLNFVINNVKDVVRNEVVGENETYDGQVCQNYDLKNVSYGGDTFWQFYCDRDLVYDCAVKCPEHYHDSCTAPDDTQLSSTFWIFFVIFLFSNIFFSPVLSLVDAISYDILGEKRGLWGKQRLWGTLGFALFAITSTFIMDKLSSSKTEIDYSVSFYIFAGLNMIGFIIVAFFLQFSELITCGQIFKNVTSLFCLPEVVVFMIMLTFFGIFNSVTEAFLFWYLLDLGSSQIVLGLCLVFSCVPEIVILKFAGKIIKKIGHIPCLYLSFAAYFVRFLSYSFLTNPWYVLPIELLHSLCYALMYAAASAYASIITPKGMSSTIQGLIGGLYFGFGKGIGSLVTGKLYDSETGLGERWTFRFYALLSLFLLLVYGLIQTFVFRKSAAADGKQDPEKEEPGADDGTQGEHLLSTNAVSNENSEL